MATPKYYESPKAKEDAHKVEPAEPAETAHVSAAAPHKGSMRDRTRGVELALEAHRGKGLSADEIVKEAAIFEAYLAGGDAKDAAAKEAAAPVDAGMPKAS